MRDLFLLDPAIVFLNHGSFGACPLEVLAAQHRWQCEMERNPVAFLARRSAALLRDAREALAGALGARADDLVFVPNATTGINTVAASLALRPGDEVLTTDLEYGACDAAWQRACDRAGARHRRIGIALPLRAESLVDRLIGAVTPATRMIWLSHITSTTALTLPVAQVCEAARALGVPTLVDGAHAPGQVDLAIDSIGADYYVGNCHKWLCAPKGSAFLHARPERQAALHPTVISWGQVDAPDAHGENDGLLGRTPFERRMQWQGTRDLSACLAVPAALAFQTRHDWPAVRRRCHDLAREALHALSRRHGLTPIADDAHWAQMVAIPVPAQDPAALQARLLTQSGIEIPVTTHAGRTFVRLSVQGYNTADDIARLIEAPALQ